jgi:tetratricopeptide (TPR) repeat protein/tRNA A-37 threonylcarbamoyl transferase component Bud32
VAGAVLFGNYELLERIAEGGMAEVWRARSRGAAGFEKTVVIKRVLPALMANPGFAELLVREAKIASRLSHANIVQIFDLGEEAGAYFIAMEHVAGKDLGAVLAWEQRQRAAGREGLTPALKLFVVGEVAKALDYAHRRKGEDGRPLAIVHRDVSPQNVLLGYEGEVKVADFGIARADQQDLGRGEDPRVIRGKYAYMSPEQARGEPLDRRSDLFSLGIVLWELATRERLFRGANPQDTLERVRRAEVPPRDLVADGWPPEIDAVLRRALARDPGDRYPSAGDLYLDLSQLLFRMREPVGEAELAAAMQRMFPPAERERPNKLRVDLLARAASDASSTGALERPASGSDTPLDGSAGEDTALGLRVSRRVSVETRRVVLLGALRRVPDDEPLFSRGVEAYGGLPQHDDDLLVAVFGAAGEERALDRAVRAALEVRRRAVLDGVARVDPVPPMAVVQGDARVYGGERVDPESAALARVRDAVLRAISGEVVVEPTMIDELGRTFRIGRAVEADVPVVDGFRSRRERDLAVVRLRSPLVGRRAELDRLASVLGAVEHEGRGRCVVVVGEAGSGKTRLLAELRALAGATGATMLTGRGSETAQERPYLALADLVMDLCGVEDEDTPAERFAKVERARVLGLAPREVRLFGELLGLAYPVPPEERAGRPRGIALALAIRKALVALARERPVLVALEDLHWMDEATRQVLRLLVGGLRRARVLVVLTARPGALLPPVATETLELGPVDADACLRVFAAAAGARAVDHDVAAAVTELAAGNAGWAEELSLVARERAVIEIVEAEARFAGPIAAAVRDGTHESAAEALPVPASVAATVLAVAAQLAGDDVDLLRIVCAFERSVTPAVAAAVHGLPLDVVESSLRRLLGRRLIAPEAGEVSVLRPRPRWGGGALLEPLPPRVRAASGLVRRAVLGALPEGGLARLHARIASALERAPDRAAWIDDLALHSARASDRRRAPDYLVAAGQAARAAGDPARAAQRFAQAVAVLAEQPAEEPTGERLVHVALKAAEAALAAAKPAVAEGALARAAGARALEADALLRVRRGLALARAAGQRGDDRGRLACLEAAARDLGALSESAVEELRLRGEAELELGEALAATGRVHEALVRLRAAVETLARAGEPARHGRALCSLAAALARAAQSEDARATVAQALALAARLGTPDIRRASLAATAEVAVAEGDPSSAAARFAEARELAEQGAPDHEVADLCLRAALAAFDAGLASAAAEAGRAAARVARRTRRAPLEALGRAVVLAVDLALATPVDEPTRPPGASPSFAPPAGLAGLARAVEQVLAGGTDHEAAHALRLRAAAERAAGQHRAAAATVTRAAHHAERAGLVALARRLRAEAGVP